MFFLLQNRKTALCLKKYHKNERHLCLVAYIFTKLSQNVCIIITHILMYWFARCNCKLCVVSWFYYISWVFLYIIIDNHFMSELIYSTSTKLSQIVCLINVHILECQHVKCDCRLWMALWFDAFFWELSYIITSLKRYYLTKVLQIMCWGRTLGLKVNLSNHIFLSTENIVSNFNKSNGIKILLSF